MNRYQGMVFDSVSLENWQQAGELNIEEPPNMDVARFYDMLKLA